MSPKPPVVNVERKLLRRELADDDVRAAAIEYSSVSKKVANAFLTEIAATYELLLGNPMIGSTNAAVVSGVADLRYWPCRRHPYVVFYRCSRESIEIWRVLHASRDCVAELLRTRG